MNVGVFAGDGEAYAGFNFSQKLLSAPSSETQSTKFNVPIHLQLVERSEYMKRLQIYESTSSLGSLTSTTTSSGEDSPNPASWGKHRYSTYYERLPFFKNPFSPHHKKTQKLSYLTSAISPDSTKFVLVSKDKFLVYNINADEPRLLCCGMVNGRHGPNFDSLAKEQTTKSGRSKKTVQFKSCALSERLLVLACSDGSLRVHDVLNNGSLFYSYEVGIPIESVDISPKGDLIGCGLQGRNRQTKGTIMLLISFEFQNTSRDQGVKPDVLAKLTELQRQEQQAKLHDLTPPPTTVQSPNFLRKLGSKSSLRSLKKAAERHNNEASENLKFVSSPIFDLKLAKLDTKLITLPYKGIVDNIKFSEKGDKLIISTYKTESKFVVFDVRVPLNIKLIMKSSRSPVEAGVSGEGITDFQLFGGDDELMVISSNAPRSPPMVLDTRINSKDFNIDSKPVQPRKVLKLDSIGNGVHKCCVNSTCDLAAFLTTDGKIWLAHLNDDFDVKKLEVIDKVSGSQCFKNTASMKFSKDGAKMFILDLQGVLFVQDFSSILARKTLTNFFQK